MTRKIHILQHASFEGPGSIADWARVNNFQITKTEFYNNNWLLPCHLDFDFLVIMGGPMGVNDETKFPWLKEEKKLIEQAINSGKKVYGACLGVQLLASVLGASVYPNSHKEIGWYEIEKTTESNDVKAIASFPDRFLAFHWHGDTYDLPHGCKNVFSSNGCKQQGFVLNSNVIGLQFHIEVTSDDILRFLENMPNEVAIPGTFIQTASQIKANLSKSEQLRPLIFDFLDNLIQPVITN